VYSSLCRYESEGARVEAKLVVPRRLAFDCGSGSSSINPPAADGGEATPTPKAIEESKTKTETNRAGVLGASPESESNTKTGKPKAAPDGSHAEERQDRRRKIADCLR
jgi:hypothetical protein